MGTLRASSGSNVRTRNLSSAAAAAGASGTTAVPEEIKVTTEPQTEMGTVMEKKLKDSFQPLELQVIDTSGEWENGKVV